MADAAKSGEARIRDDDGTNLLVLPERRVAALGQVVQAAALLARVERTLEEQGAPLEAHVLGEWSWLRVFGAEDVRAFIAEIREAITLAAHQESSALLETQVAAWQTTARQLADPVQRRTLLGAPSGADFVEAQSPRQTSA